MDPGTSQVFVSKDAMLHFYYSLAHEEQGVEIRMPAQDGSWPGPGANEDSTARFRSFIGSMVGRGRPGPFSS